MREIVSVCVAIAMIGLPASAGGQIENVLTPPSCPLDGVVLDIDADGKPNCAVYAQQDGKSPAELRIFFSGRKLWETAHPRKYLQTDDKIIEILDLKKYKNSRYHGPKTGLGIYVARDASSSVIYYWDPQAHKIAEFWETD